MSRRAVPTADEATDSLGDDFRVAMRRLATTIAIVTAGGERDSWRGMAATALMSVSADPPTILVAVNRNAGINAVLVPGAPLCVNLLATRHHFLVPIFGGDVSGAVRFQHGTWYRSAKGPPILADAAASLLCETREIVPVHTHDLFIAEVRAITVQPEFDPLLWGDGMLARAVCIPRPDR